MKKDKEDIISQATSIWSKELNDREARNANIVIYGLEEPPIDITAGGERQTMDKKALSNMFSALKVKVNEADVKFTARIGKLTAAAATKPRPVKLSFWNLPLRDQIFNAARNLPKTAFHAISIVPDLTDSQRKEDKELHAKAEKMNAKMSREDSENYVYRCVGRRGERQLLKLKKRDGDRRVSTTTAEQGNPDTNRTEDSSMRPAIPSRASRAMDSSPRPGTSRDSSARPAPTKTRGRRMSRQAKNEERTETDSMETETEGESDAETQDNGNKRGREEESGESEKDSPNKAPTKAKKKRAKKT